MIKLKRAKLIAFIALFALLLLSLTSCLDQYYVTIIDTSINEDGELIITYSDGTIDNLGVVVGEDGDSVLAICDAELNENDELIVTYNNGTQENLGRLTPTESPVGIESASINSLGELIIVYTDGNEVNLGVIRAEGAGEDSSTNTESAITKALRSSVSILAEFTETTTVNGLPIDTDTSASQGSGVIYQLDKSTGDAYIITNYHVVFDKDSDTKISDDISVFLYGQNYLGYEISAEYIGGSLHYDIAVLRIEDSQALRDADVTAATFSDSNDIILGEEAIAIGNALGEGISSTVGVVSVISENLEMKGADEETDVTFRTIRVDTPINKGNSGGGLFNSSGNIIGIVNAKAVSNEVDNVGYAIPANIAKAVADNLIYNNEQNGTLTLKKPLLGVYITASSIDLVYDAESDTVSTIQTVIIESTDETGIAHGVLLANDQINSFIVRRANADGAYTDDAECTVTQSYHVVDKVLTTKPGDIMVFNITRIVEGNETELTVEIEITDDCIIDY